MVKYNKSLDTRVVILEQHIGTLNTEMGEIKKILTDPENGLCFKVDRLDNNLKWIKWVLVTLAVPVVFLAIQVLVRGSI